MDDLDQVDELLDKSDSKLLDFERQMFLDLIYNDALVICGKGISYENVLYNLLRVYIDPANLILVLNCDDNEEITYTKLLNSPHVHAVANTANEREKNYLDGGVQFISTRILVVDLLKKRIPIELITGIFVLRAHKIIESCQEAFALRLYRQQNKTGFIKAFSSSAEAFTYGYGHIEKVMRNLFVCQLFLWPRFHALIQKSMKAYEPISVEFHIPMTHKMVLIQTHILDLMNFIVKELKRINPKLDLEEVNVENCVTKRFHKILQSQLDTVWNQLSSKTKLLIADLKVLRSLMFTTIYNDPISLYSTLRQYRTADYAMSNSGWTLLSAAEQIFKVSKERVFNAKEEFDPEPCPKWKALSEILKVEIPTDIKTVIKDKSQDFDKNVPIKILILCNDARTCYQLNQYLTQGHERTLFFAAMKNDITVQKLSDKYKSINGGSGIVKDSVIVKNIKTFESKPVKPTSSKPQNVPLVMSVLKKRTRNEVEDTKDDSKDVTENSKEILDSDSMEDDYFRDSYVLTMSQNIDGNESSSGSDFDLTLLENVAFELCSEFVDLDLTAIINTMQKPTVFIQTFRSDQNKMMTLDKTLSEMNPDYIVMYNSNVSAIRQIEVHEARLQRHPKRRLKVFVLMHDKTVEEQSFLTNLRREKKAFELLIHTKRIMVIPEYQDGKSDVTDFVQKSPEEESNTRQAGGQAGSSTQDSKKELPKIIVDMREFRSELPCLIHKRGIEVVPLTITIGDYILSPEICVERKSISDLIGSLNSGRLYNQCIQMTRFYSKPILLIEFDQNRPFHLQGHFMLSTDSNSMNADIVQKLQLLTIHFPKLRIVWSPSPYATAQLFEELKLNKAEPDTTIAIQLGSEDPTMEFDAITDKFNANIHDFLLKLPGINSKNINAVMRKGKSLKDLLKLTVVELTELLGNTKDAKQLWEIFHNSHKPVAEEKTFGKFKKNYKKF
ncbi:unnamed protein product [Diamesa serratosioi]